MSVSPISPVGETSGTSQVALQWQLIQDQSAMAADEAAQASRQVLALAQAKVTLDDVNAAAEADRQVTVKQQVQASQEVQALRQAQVGEQILVSQDIHASQEILATQVVRATVEVQPNPQVTHGEEIQAIEQASASSGSGAGLDLLA